MELFDTTDLIELFSRIALQNGLGGHRGYSGCGSLVAHRDMATMVARVAVVAAVATVPVVAPVTSWRPWKPRWP